MSIEERNYVIRVLRKEAACGMMEACTILNQLIAELRKRPAVIMDNPATPKVTIEWKRKYPLQ